MATEFTLTYGQEIIVADKTIPASNVFSGTGRSSVSEDLIPSDDLLLPNFGLDVSSIKAIVILSSVDVALKTYLVAELQDTINLLAGVPYVWHTGSYFANLLDTDFDNTKVTEAGGATGTIEIEAITDATP